MFFVIVVSNVGYMGGNNVDWLSSICLWYLSRLVCVVIVSGVGVFVVIVGGYCVWVEKMVGCEVEVYNMVLEV